MHKILYDGDVDVLLLKKEQWEFIEGETKMHGVQEKDEIDAAGRFIPGCYTLAVSEELPEEYQNICADNNVQYVPPKRT
ncbi:hypothetical protein M5K25_023623 [Dendrobium thyrsiflorum]|uniref:Uncharacterized protein n=1 Tax=Dendrobium thyrsiflorum TaxID=117978 RepID=A0ABD0U8J2_DENTH